MVSVKVYPDIGPATETAGENVFTIGTETWILMICMMPAAISSAR